MFRCKEFFLVLYLGLGPLENGVACFVLLHPDKNDIKESTNLIDNLAVSFRNADRPLGDETPTDVLVKLILLIMDVLTTASGSYLILPDLNDVDEKQQQVIAIASTNLWMKLPYMTAMEEVFFNASQLTLTPLLSKPSKTIGNIHNALFHNIEMQIKINSSLYKVYKQEKGLVEQQDSPNVAEGTIDFQNIIPIYALQKLLTVLEDYPRLQYFIVHAQFASYAGGASCLSHANATQQLNNYAIAQSVVLLANQPKIAPRVQELYEKALRKTVETLKNQKKSGGDVLDADQILFLMIEKVFSWTPKLAAQLSETKDDLMNKI